MADLGLGLVVVVVVVEGCSSSLDFHSRMDLDLRMLSTAGLGVHKFMG